jgi:hypothetical protein
MDPACQFEYEGAIQRRTLSSPTIMLLNVPPP